MNKQQRKSETKRKRRAKEDRRRKAILDKPPSTLRVIDKLHVCPVDFAQFKTEMLKQEIEKTAELRQFIDRGWMPVYFCEDVVEWLQIKWPSPSKITTHNIALQMGEINPQFAPAWLEATYASKHTPQLYHQPACGVMYWTADEIKDAMLKMHHHMTAKQPNYKGAFHFRCFYTNNKNVGVEAMPVEIFVTIDEMNVPSDLFSRGGYREGIPKADQDFLWNLASTTALMGLASLSFLSTHNVKATNDNRDRTSAEIKYAEAAKRQLPKYECRVIDLWPEKKAQQSTGVSGTGTGTKRRRVRWHRVVGHFYMRNMKKFWRRGHSRGDKRLGIVETRKRIRLGQPNE